MTSPLAWPLAYAACGLSILPVKADKTPLTPHGLRDATRDPTVIEDWLQRWPCADLAWALPASAVAVKHGKNGYRDFERLDGRRRAGRCEAGDINAQRRDATPPFWRDVTRRGRPLAGGVLFKASTR
jgi:Bifunctional DNA primase/polymerase, N-terminal